MPMNAVCLTAAISVLLSLIYLVSMSVFYSVVGAMTHDEGIGD